MLIKLSGRGLRALGTDTSATPFIGRIATSPDHPNDREILLSAGNGSPPGFRAYLVRGVGTASERRDTFALGSDFDYLDSGDVVRIDPERRAIATLYRRSSRFNSMLVTERCDNYCVMCSQPPKAHDDSHLVDELLEAIPLMSPDTSEIGITGGEPSLLGSRLVELVASLQRHVPRAAVHILSNGRSFAKTNLAASLADLKHPDLMIGIPLYADVSEIHDFVVQSRGAFDDTIRGILALKEVGIAVELRFVIHKETYDGLPQLARFIARNLLFVDHVALMGLELMGFAKANIDALWIDPLDYRDQLAVAVEILDRAGMRVSIYNHQLCVLPSGLHPFARASISDWKNAYDEACSICTLRSTCGGFFASSTLRKSRGIASIIGKP